MGARASYALYAFQHAVFGPAAHAGLALFSPVTSEIRSSPVDPAGTRQLRRIVAGDWSRIVHSSTPMSFIDAEHARLRRI